MIDRGKIENSALAGGAREGVARSAKDDPARSPAVPAFAAPQGPAPRSLIGAAAGFAASMARFAASGFQRIGEQSQRLRVSHCEPCRYRKQNRCTLCGCFFAKKAWLPHEDCPIGKWPI